MMPSSSRCLIRCQHAFCERLTCLAMSATTARVGLQTLQDSAIRSVQSRHGKITHQVNLYSLMRETLTPGVVLIALGALADRKMFNRLFLDHPRSLANRISTSATGNGLRRAIFVAPSRASCMGLSPRYYPNGKPHGIGLYDRMVVNRSPLLRSVRISH